MRKNKFYLTGSNRDEFIKYPGEEKEQCARCKKTVLGSEKLKKANKDNFSFTNICPFCRSSVFYVYKDKLQNLSTLGS